MQLHWAKAWTLTPTFRRGNFAVAIYQQTVVGNGGKRTKLQNVCKQFAIFVEKLPNVCYNASNDTLQFAKGDKNMRTLAKFQKVDWEIYSQHGNQQTYDDIKLPKRATTKSAGYDFFAPTTLVVEPQQTITVATGIRAFMPDSWVLMIYPRSGLGFKYKLRLNNTVGIIDADYVNSDNQGHIFVRMTNESDKQLVVEKGTAFAQGIFTQYLLTEDDDVTEIRNGGLGSTTK